MIATPGIGRRDDPSTGRALAALIAFLVVFDVSRHLVIPDGAHTAANVAAIAVVGLIARLARMSADELGLARRHLMSGLRWGGVAFLAISLVLVIGAAVPATRGAFDTDDVGGGLGGMLWRVLVVIPVATVVFEELAFRGALLGLLVRRLEIRPAALVSAVLFGLWHVPSTVADGWVTVVGTVIATTAAGLGFAWLRRGSGSLLAPVLAHIATNSVTFALAWSVAR